VKDEHRGELFRDVVGALERAGHKMCVLRGYESYPERIGSDIDAISENPTEIPRILSEQRVASVVQTSRYVTKYIYVLCRRHRDEPVFINLDVSADYRYYGRLFFSGEEFLSACRPFKFFKVPSAELEFGGYLIKHITQRTLDESKCRRLTELYEENPAGCERLLTRFFPEAQAKFIANSARSGDWKPVRTRIEHLRGELLNKTGREQRLRLLLHRLGSPGRRLERLLRPAGLMIALLGVDGAGKSTVMAQIGQDLSPAFRGTKLYHRRPLVSARGWRERLRPGKKDEDKHIVDAHAQPYRDLATSLAKLGFWWVDYVLLGYMVDIFPRLVHSSLVLFDRYYDDLLVYPKRYRYGGPLWLARFVGRLIPRPHLVFLLDAPPEVIQVRKQEVPFEETARQREAYLEVVKSLPNGHVVDASKPLSDVVTEVEDIILDYMAKRTARKLNILERW
jgi:thymidylate kinase